MFSRMREDIRCVFERDPAARSVWEVVTCYPGFHALQLHRLSHTLWTWQLRCLASPCVPRLPPSDKFHVFHFKPAHIDYVTPTGRRAYGIDAYWPPVEVLSQVSPGVVNYLRKTNRLNWRIDFTPVAAPDYRTSPNVIFWKMPTAS